MVFLSEFKPSKVSLPLLFNWRILQMIVWLIGFFILWCLFFYPSLGELLFWNILIPIAPILLVLLPGVWRNVCPLATTNLLPRHFNLSKRKKLTFKQIGILNLIGVIFLYLIIPLRHAIFNNCGVATGVLILLMVAIGTFAGFFYEWKSVWCSGLCPVHPVEKLYGGNVLFTVINAHCDSCMNCVTPCPDSTPNIKSTSTTKTKSHKLAAILITGGLPGFIWGWFHVPDAPKIEHLSKILSVFTLPFSGLAFTLIIYYILETVINKINDRTGKHNLQKKLTSIFAATAVSCYYWYRVPSLFGYGIFKNDGLLINLQTRNLGMLLTTANLLTTFFFFYWFVFRKANKKSWTKRPAVSSKQITAYSK